VNHYERELEAAVERWRRLGRPRPDVVLVAGSGLSVPLGEPIAGPEPLGDWVPFPVHEVAGHEHAVELLEPSPGRRLLYFRGRLHSYQAYDAAQVVFGIRWAALLGARVLLMTNAAGGIRGDWAPGTLAAISDHLNLTGLNPLRGEPPTSWGARFPDMADAYAPELRELAMERARDLGFTLEQGVYAGLAGPSYETPAEIRMLRTLGADLAGMSTVLEVIAARHLGLRALVLSLVTNPAAGVATAPLDHAEVLAAGRQAAARVTSLLAALLRDPALDVGEPPART